MVDVAASPDVRLLPPRADTLRIRSKSEPETNGQPEFASGLGNQSTTRPQRLMQRTVLRLLDLAFVSATFVSLPILCVIAAAIRLTSPGPAIFRQKRIGRNGVVFVCYKFRTMKQGVPERPTHETDADDTTAFGRFLRTTKLDELPQAINVLRGEMSLVGPRPCLACQTDLISERQSRGVDRALPGITGLGQVYKIDMADPRRLARYDALYVRKQSVGLYLLIVLRTAKVVSAVRNR